MLEVTLKQNTLVLGEIFALRFQRTLRIPDDGKTYPLPPGLGPFPICRIEDYRERLPSTWAEHGGVFIPMYQREALWISFLPPPITAKTYTQYGLPWFDLYDDRMEDLPAPEVLKKVKTFKEMDEKKGFTSQQDDESVDVPEDKVIKYKIDSDEEVKDGNW